MLKTKNRHSVPSVSSNLAKLYLGEILKKGKTIKIPSLEIRIQPSPKK